MVRDKIRIRFRKGGDLRLISHHDLMRAFERMLRRAAVPFHSTAGFNPKPRLIFALPLPLGTVGLDEVAELELDEEMAPEELQDRLARHAIPGLTVLDARRIDPKAAARIRRVAYRVPVPPDRVMGLWERTVEFLGKQSCLIARTRPRPRTVDVRPYVLDLRVLPDALEIDLRVTPGGSARPEEVLEALGLRDVLDVGAVIERTRIELEDEDDLPAADATRAGEPGLPVGR